MFIDLYSICSFEVLSLKHLKLSSHPSSSFSTQIGNPHAILPSSDGFNIYWCIIVQYAFPTRTLGTSQKPNNRRSGCPLPDNSTVIYIKIGRP